MGLDVTIFINRIGATPLSIGGTITVTSDITNQTFSGYTLENRNPPNLSLPVRAGTYSAFLRMDRSVGRVELTDVPGATRIQLHVANYPEELEGCFGVGLNSRTDYIGKSVKAMNAISDIIMNDGTGVINVTIGGWWQ
ncbi:DUF5675 family protein [Desulfurispirillum indicum]|nr:DUF5675 family protein [Desulfurispirillum indicum]